MAPSQTLFVQDASSLYSYQPSTNAFSRIGSTGFLLTDIAVTPSGSAYGVSFSAFYGLNALTGAATLRTNLTRTDINALTSDNTGQLFVAGSTTTTIYKLNSFSGVLTVFGTATASSAGDLLVVNDKLYLATSNATLDSFDRVSGERLSSVFHGVSDVFGLSIGADGQVYGFAGTRAYTIDLVSGQAALAATFPIGQSVFGSTQSATGWQNWSTGSSVNDVLRAGSGNTMISGLLGDDSLIGSTGNDLLIGGAGNDFMDGGAGTDTAQLSGSRTSYALAKTSSGYTVTDVMGRDGVDAVIGVERLKFADRGVALDTFAFQAGGQTQLLLGAVLGKDLLATKKPLIGAALDLFDQGFTVQQLSGAVMRLDIWNTLANGGKSGVSNTQIAQYLLTTVNQAAPDAATLMAAVAALNTETDAAQGNFLSALALSAANQVQVGLVGLAATGLEFEF
jgi:Ca2+-binding RTX toxin-like protein